jgi:hypothetical protein
LGCWRAADPLRKLSDVFSRLQPPGCLNRIFARPNANRHRNPCIRFLSGTPIVEFDNVSFAYVPGKTVPTA